MTHHGATGLRLAGRRGATFCTSSTRYPSAAAISQRVLTSTLRGLERDGIVERTVRPTNPPQVEYALTKLGESLLASWAQGHRSEIEHARDAFDGKRKLDRR